MILQLLYLCASLALASPFLVIAVILVHYYLRRAIFRRNQRLGRQNRGFCPSSFALGTALQLIPMFYRPSMDLRSKQGRLKSSRKTMKALPRNLQGIFTASCGEFA